MKVLNIRLTDVSAEVLASFWILVIFSSMKLVQNTWEF